MADKNKVYGKKRSYTHFLYRGPRGQWYPRSVADELVDKVTRKWERNDIEYKEVPKEEMVNQGAKLDLGGDHSPEVIRKARDLGNE